MKHLHRSKTDRVIFGVCGGLGEYVNTDPVIFRLLFILLTILGGSGILLYLIAALIIPGESEPRDVSLDAGARIKNRVESLASELKSKNAEGKTRGAWLGWVVIFIGVILLINQFLPKNIISWNVVLAVIIIAFGVRLMRRNTNNSNETKKIEPLDAEKSDHSETSHVYANAEKKDEHKPSHTKETVREVHHHHHRGSGIFGLFFGLLIVVIGFVFLAQNLGLVSGLDFSYVAKFWPVFIIIAGLSLLSRGTWLGSLLAFLITLAIIAALVTAYIFPSSHEELTVKDFSIIKSENADQMDVYIKGGAGSLKITSNDTDRVEGHFESSLGTLSITTSTENNTDKIRFETQGSVKKLWGKFTNNLNLSLAETAPLDLSVDFGAAKIDIDASKLKVQNLNLQSGASSIRLTLGSLLASSTVRVSAGASSIDIGYPKNVGMRVIANAGLSSKNFFDFKQIDEHAYESSNYETASKKIELSLDAGVSSISIRSY